MIFGVIVFLVGLEFDYKIAASEIGAFDIHSDLKSKPITNPRTIMRMMSVSQSQTRLKVWIPSGVRLITPSNSKAAKIWPARAPERSAPAKIIFGIATQDKPRLTTAYTIPNDAKAFRFI